MAYVLHKHQGELSDAEIRQHLVEKHLSDDYDLSKVGSGVLLYFTLHNQEHIGMDKQIADIEEENDTDS